MIARNVAAALERSGWVRKMFEEGSRLRAELGADRVADLSLGNPVLDPPEAARARLVALCTDPEAGAHRYTPNAGREATRAAVAACLSRATGAPFAPEHIVMSSGAGGGLNATFRAILDPGDEVILLAPYFVDYPAYVANHGGRAIVVGTDAQFAPDPDRIARALTTRTRALVVNSPNNPTGVTYSRESLEKVASVLEQASQGRDRPILLISDEPYRAIVYDGVEVPWPVRLYPHTVHVTSFSKSLSLAGERIGYVAVGPACEQAEALVDALILATRILGFVNAPALMQRWVEGLLYVSSDYSRYARNRAYLLAGLRRAGYAFVEPTGAFYVLPEVPRADRDDMAFLQDCLRHRLLVAPGSGFGAPGFFRLSYAVSDRDLELGLEILANLHGRV